jgi:hypothetical protein
MIMDIKQPKIKICRRSLSKILKTKKAMQRMIQKKEL